MDSHTHVFAARDLVTDASSRLAVIHNGIYPAYGWNSRERRSFRQLDIGANTPFHCSELRFETRRKTCKFMFNLH